MTLSLGVLEGSLNYFRDFVPRCVGGITMLFSILCPSVCWRDHYTIFVTLSLGVLEGSQHYFRDFVPRCVGGITKLFS